MAVGRDLRPQDAHAEYAGLLRLSPAAVERVLRLRDRARHRFATAGIPELLVALMEEGPSVRAVDVGGRWAELNAPQDLARFVLGTEAHTLERLRPLVEHCSIGEQVTFTVETWRSDAEGPVDRIRARFGGRKAVVRSSAVAEDSCSTANARVFASVAGVPVDGAPQGPAPAAPREPDAVAPPSSVARAGTAGRSRLPGRGARDHPRRRGPRAPGPADRGTSQPVAGRRRSGGRDAPSGGELLPRSRSRFGEFSSFVPASLADSLRERLVEAYLDRLETHPHLHDKIEVEIAFTCLNLDFETQARRLLEAGIAPAGVESLGRALGEVTRRGPARHEGACPASPPSNGGSRPSYVSTRLPSSGPASCWRSAGETGRRPSRTSPGRRSRPPRCCARRSEKACSRRRWSFPNSPDSAFRSRHRKTAMRPLFGGTAAVYFGRRRSAASWGEVVCSEAGRIAAGFPDAGGAHPGRSIREEVRRRRPRRPVRAQGPSGSEAGVGGTGATPARRSPRANILLVSARLHLPAGRGGPTDRPSLPARFLPAPPCLPGVRTAPTAPRTGRPESGRASWC